MISNLKISVQKIDFSQIKSNKPKKKILPEFSFVQKRFFPKKIACGKLFWLFCFRNPCENWERQGSGAGCPCQVPVVRNGRPWGIIHHMRLQKINANYANTYSDPPPPIETSEVREVLSRVLIEQNRRNFPLKGARPPA